MDATLKRRAAAVAMAAPATLTPTSAGRTAAQFSVSPTGAATYNIPLWTPPGVRNIEPQLALHFTSGGPDGMMGPGWALSGFSGIVRCGKTWASSGGSLAAVTLTTSDDFCLDGNRLREHLFGALPRCGALVAEEAPGTPVGFALFFATYSTFRTRACLHLEDLFVLQEHRGHGHGQALLAAVAQEAVRLQCPRLDWNVLDWNQPAIDFYESLGARRMREWQTCRLTGPALTQYA